MIKFSCQSHLSTLLVRTEIWIIADCTQIFEKLIFFQIFQYFKRNIWKFERNIGKFERNIGKFVQFSDFLQTSSGGKKRFNELNWKEAMKWVELKGSNECIASFQFNSIQFVTSFQFSSFIAFPRFDSIQLIHRFISIQ